MADTDPVIIEVTPEKVGAWLIGRVEHYLDEPAGSIDPGMSLAEYGMDSVHAFTLCGEIEDALGVAVDPAMIWDMETLTSLAYHIAELAARKSSVHRK
jgi:acyl carrier protein